MKFEIVAKPVSSLMKGYERTDEGLYFARESGGRSYFLGLDNGRLPGGAARGKTGETGSDFDANVIRSILQGCPLGLVYVMDKSAGAGTPLEIMQGRRRMKAVASYVDNEFEVDGKDYKTLSKAECDKFNAYAFQFCVCTGTAGELFDWFKRINVGVIIRSESWLFSRTYGGVWFDDLNVRMSSEGNDFSSVFASDVVSDRVSQLMGWAAEREDVSVEDYMSENQNKADASGLWQYLKNVHDWAVSLFGTDLKPFGRQEWGVWYNNYSREFDTSCSDKFQGQIAALLADDSVQNKSDIVEYLLTDDMSVLRLKKLTEKDKAERLSRQGGKCAHCGCDLSAKDGKITLVNPWPRGKIDVENAEVLCRKCDKAKRNKIMQAFG